MDYPYSITTASMRFLFTIVFLFFILTTMAAVREVGKGKQFSTITSAIKAAGNGDVIKVYHGVYAEGEILIDKPLHLQGVDFPIVDGKLLSQIFFIQANNVTIEGFKIINGGYSSSYDWAAIKVLNCKYVIIRNNQLHNNAFGINLQNCSFSRVENNRVSGNPMNEIQSGNAIHCWKSNNLRILNNEVSGHRDGIYFEFVTQSFVGHNLSYKNLRYGLHFMFSNNDLYFNNTFKNNGAGVAVMFSKNVNMAWNRFEENWGSASYGILLKEISGGVIERNIFSKNTMGIFMEGSSHLQVANNIFKANGWALRIQSSCEDNFLFNNNFMANTFDVATNGTMQLNNFSGNYWDKYEGYDLSKDGYGDVPFQPVSLYSMVVEKIPAASVLLRSFMVTIMDKAERVIPSITPVQLKDDKPRMKPVAL